MVDRWENRLENKPARTGLWIVTGLIAFVLVVIAVIWALKVFTSPVRGAGDAYAEKNGAGNFIAQQHSFIATNEDYKSTLVKIVNAREMVKAEQAGPRPTDSLAAYEAQRQLSTDQATVMQLIQHCQDDATNYNTASQAYLSEDFRNANLPYRLDPATCAAP